MPKNRSREQERRRPPRRRKEAEAPVPVAVTEPTTKSSKSKKPKVDELEELLKSVSRSFYISVRFLPKTVRPIIGLAYLLARASDTIADSTHGSNADRIALLTAFMRLVKMGRDQEYLEQIHRGVTGKISDSDERRLMDKLPKLIDLLEELPLPERHEVVRVLLRILYAQELDLKRFTSRTEPTAIPTSESLDEYTYFIAGCVGEFWTRVCRMKEPDFSSLSDAELLPLSVRFGKGLQLVNILRDLPVDLKQGRCYLPASQLEDAGVSVESLRRDPAKAAAVLKHWNTVAREHLEAGWKYVQSIKNLRIRYACAIPILIGLRTIALMKKNPPLLSKEKVKVPRSEVKMIMLKAGVGTLVGPFLQQMYRGIQKQLA